ncbi:MAG: PD40 domain-containing protein [Acidobacteria bacterium]|nr:PD40 domain-containing protein [Acidobacteriota bacterium]
MTYRPAALLVVFSVALSGSPAHAQEYFGQNKVQYKTFDFQIMKTEHFDIYFYPAEREGAAIAARMAERWDARYQRLLSHTLRGRQPLLLYASQVDFQQTNAVPGQIGEGTGGVTESGRRLIVLPMGGPLGDTNHVIGHELVHAFQYDITTNPNAPGEPRAGQLPLWFIEGMAEYLSLGPVDPNTAMWLRDAQRDNSLPAVKDLDNPKYFPYRWGQAFWAYVGGRWGDDAIRPMLNVAAASGGDMEQTFQKVLGISTKQFSEDWHAAIQNAYAPVLEKTTPAAEVGRVIVKGSGLGGQLNVGPALSPDGRLLAFLSERSLISIDLYVADAHTGEVLRKLTSTATNPHFSSIQFIYSAGAWAGDSRRIAIATVTGGRPALAIFDAQNGNKEREIDLHELDQIFNPTWAPDGHAVAFTGMAHGLTDLYVYDLQTSALRQLTDDPYADLQPAWSPDGLRIAFATDRFTTRLETLDIGPYRLALIDPQSGRIEEVPATDAENINPQWSPDGRLLFFISDRNGIPNLYRVPLDGGGAESLTDVATGLSGITDSSPVLSVAAETGTAAFTVYLGGDYAIHALDSAATAAPVAVDTTAARAATLPPVDRKPSEVAQMLANATMGLPAANAEFQIAAYKPRLQLEGVAQPSIAVGGSRYGATIGGGIGLQFGDLLGNHVLTTVVQVDSGVGGSFSVKNTAAQLAYLNQSRRWNWGAAAGQLPYLSGGFQSGIGSSPTGEPVEIDQAIIFRQTERAASGIAAYPFNQAQRVELQAGVSQLSFDQITRTTVYSLNSGALLSDDTATVALAQPLTLGTTSAALVYDTSTFGATSPIDGQRYRFEASPSFGSIDYTSLLADYRRYLMPVSFYTIAGRVVHFGRYGSGGDDQRLFPLYLGYPQLVRGYDVDDFDAIDCPPTPDASCAAFDRLIGSRILVGNLELRFPVLRPFGVSQRMYGPVPAEVALFVDAGVAWDRGQSPSFLGGTRHGVSSAGVALRVNLLGFAVGQFDIARPFQRPGQGWVFQFSLTPGF